MELGCDLPAVAENPINYLACHKMLRNDAGLNDRSICSHPVLLKRPELLPCIKLQRNFSKNPDDAVQKCLPASER